MKESINNEVSLIVSRLRKAIEVSGYSYYELEKLTGIPKSTIQRYATGNFKRLPFNNIEKIAEACHVSARTILGWESPEMKSATGYVKLYDGIPAGAPAFLDEQVIDHLPTLLPHPENYAAIKVHGDSMIGAGIIDGCTVMIKKQECAEDGQIVACRVNNEEVTLKRFRQQGDTVLLMPENPNYSPIIVPVSDFENGSAQILGVLVQIIIDVR